MNLKAELKLIRQRGYAKEIRQEERLEEKSAEVQSIRFVIIIFPPSWRRFAGEAKVFNRRRTNTVEIRRR